jgi:hypothetical protein
MPALPGDSIAGGYGQPAGPGDILEFGRHRSTPPTHHNAAQHNKIERL